MVSNPIRVLYAQALGHARRPIHDRHRGRAHHAHRPAATLHCRATIHMKD